MDASGPIFAVLVVACLFYVVPRQLSWRIPSQKEAEQQSPLHLAMKTVHAGLPPTKAGQDGEDQGAAVSTLLMRRAGRRAALRLARQAERRRTSVFWVLLVVLVATIPCAVMGWWLQWWVPVAVAAVVVVWALYSRFEARRAQRLLDALGADTELSDDEKTVAVQLQPVLPADESAQAPVGAIVGPNGDVQLSLWDPITVVPATYISAPTAARTVRTIDLNPPALKLPVTDDARPEDDQRLRAA